MRRFIRFLVIVLVGATVFGCRTNEENYRKAYEKAIERDRDGLDETIYTQIRREAKPMEAVVDGDTIGMKREFVSLTKDQTATPEWLKAYSVVAGQFKQLFHARSMCERISDKGYPRVFIVETREPLYYVIAVSTDTMSVAKTALDRMLTDPPLPLREPCPWILRR